MRSFTARSRTLSAVCASIEIVSRGFFWLRSTAFSATIATGCALVELVLPSFKGRWRELGIAGRVGRPRGNTRPRAQYYVLRACGIAARAQTSRSKSARVDFIAQTLEVGSRFRPHHVEDETNADSTHHMGIVLPRERDWLIADKALHRGYRRRRLVGRT